MVLVKGPSPRVRGSHLAPPPERLRPRSIPACAGKPPFAAGPANLPWVHPRVCGEARLTELGSYRHLGPSPRVRGSLNASAAASDCGGSIPACAGKPWYSGSLIRPSGVHPRVCGEARVREDLPVDHQGPSPRVRGSPFWCALDPRCLGSIPACAGKPASHSSGGDHQWVHPRVCGEATSVTCSTSNSKGPSPRVRGSLEVAGPGAERAGSIPACAGKP